MKLKRFASGWIQYSPSKLQPKILYSILLNGRNAKITPKIEYSFLNSWKLAALVFARLHKMKLYLALICSTGKKFPLIPIGNFLQITLIGMFVLVLFLCVYWNRSEQQHIEIHCECWKLTWATVRYIWGDNFVHRLNKYYPFLSEMWVFVDGSQFGWFIQAWN